MGQKKKTGVSPKTIKWIWYAAFAPFALVALTLVHHAVFFSLEALSWTHALHTLLRIVVSTAVSAGFIWIIARIFTAKIPVRI